MLDFEQYKKHFRDKAINNGYSEEIILKCLRYSEHLNSQNLPIIYNSFHFAGLVGYNHTYLKRAIISTEFFYRTFKVKKKNGHFREISEPLPSLKEIQYFILKQILYSQKVSKYCKSYIPKKKFKEYLKFHTNAREVLTLDIADFFPSIKYKYVEHYFTKLGYGKDVVMYLSSICTYSKIKEGSDRFLPQGAPTSPYLSNLILKSFDEDVAKFCQNKSIKYTRYADDMSFSGDNVEKETLIAFVKSKLSSFNLRLNEDKINFMKHNVPQIISGVIVNKKLQLPKKERNDIRNTMFYILKFGLESHLEKSNEKREFYLSHLLGRIQYAITLNPNDKELQNYKNELMKYTNKKS